MRNIEFTFSAEEREKLAEVVTHRELQAALGYLCTWNMSDYPYVRIHVMTSKNVEPELVAVYTENPAYQDGKRYVIGAVWHGDHFGFHS